MDNNRKIGMDELKKLVKEHFLRELDIMEMILRMDSNEVKEFRKWYIIQPYVKGIGEIQEICQVKNNKLSE